MKRRLLLLLLAVCITALALLAPAPPASADGPCYAIRKPCTVELYVYDPDWLCCVHPRGGCSYCW
jgi:hypothetical protein